MGTVTITSAGFAALPASPPPAWPSYVTWPSGGTYNGTKAYTISDADAQRLLGWIAAGQFTATPSGPATPTAVQIFLAWIQSWMSGSVAAEQQHSTPAVVPPPPISIA